MNWTQFENTLGKYHLIGAEYASGRYCIMSGSIEFAAGEQKYEFTMKMTDINDFDLIDYKTDLIYTLVNSNGHMVAKKTLKEYDASPRQIVSFLKDKVGDGPLKIDQVCSGGSIAHIDELWGSCGSERKKL